MLSAGCQMDKTAAIAVVVVMYNSAQLLPALLESLDRGLRGLTWHLTLVDNASTDGSPDAARRWHRTRRSSPPGVTVAMPRASMPGSVPRPGTEPC